MRISSDRIAGARARVNAAFCLREKRMLHNALREEYERLFRCISTRQYAEAGQMSTPVSIDVSEDLNNCIDHKRRLIAALLVSLYLFRHVANTRLLDFTEKSISRETLLLVHFHCFLNAKMIELISW